VSVCEFEVVKLLSETVDHSSSATLNIFTLGSITFLILGDPPVIVGAIAFLLELILGEFAGDTLLESTPSLLTLLRVSTFGTFLLLGLEFLELT
jgi:hypothetical protein